MMLTENQLLNLLQEIGAIQKRHVVLASGKHSNDFINLGMLFPRATLLSIICRSLVLECLGMNDTELVIGPEQGATYLASRVAERLGERCCGREIFALDAKKDGLGRFSIPENLEPLVEGK